MADPKISLEEVHRVARLARLALTEEEAEESRARLDAILGYMVELDSLDVGDVPPPYHAVPLDAPLREDVLVPSLAHEEAIAAAPESSDGGFAVPVVLEVE